jgi:hypothetical protein
MISTYTKDFSWGKNLPDFEENKIKFPDFYGR